LQRRVRLDVESKEALDPGRAVEVRVTPRPPTMNSRWLGWLTGVRLAKKKV
jgi:hypothetical protein